MGQADELRQLNVAELRTKLDEIKEEMFNLRFQRITGQVEDTSRFRAIRREIARIKTVITEKERADAQQ